MPAGLSSRLVPSLLFTSQIKVMTAAEIRSLTLLGLAFVIFLFRSQTYAGLGFARHPRDEIRLGRIIAFFLATAITVEKYNTSDFYKDFKFLLGISRCYEVITSRDFHTRCGLRLKPSAASFGYHRPVELIGGSVCTP